MAFCHRTQWDGPCCPIWTSDVTADPTPEDVTQPIVVSLDGFYEKPPRGVRSRLLRLPNGERQEVTEAANAVAGELACPCVGTWNMDRDVEAYADAIALAWCLFWPIEARP